MNNLKNFIKHPLHHSTKMSSPTIRETF